MDQKKTMFYKFIALNQIKSNFVKQKDQDVTNTDTEVGLYDTFM